MRKPRLPLVALLSLVALAFTALTGLAFASAADPATEEPRFLLLVHGGDEPAATERAAVVDEYRQWARRLAAEGHLLEADELASEAVLLRAGEGGETRRSTREPSAGGYFLIAAADLEAALAVARDCPALRRGGAVEVVPIRRD